MSRLWQWTFTVLARPRSPTEPATLTYRTGDGRLGERIIFADDLGRLSEVAERRWSCHDALRGCRCHLGTAPLSGTVSDSTTSAS